MTEPIPSYSQVISEKTISRQKLLDEFGKLCRYVPSMEKRCFAGNAIMHHLQLDNLCRVKNKKGESFYDMISDSDRAAACWELINRYSVGKRLNQPGTRFFEQWRRLYGAIVFFKPTVAISLYKHVTATAVLDPCAGWGGRMLGAAALGIPYVGIDTNTSLRPAYDELMKFKRPDGPAGQMIWEDCLSVDFSAIDYDCVLTSPPYVNLEVYPGMTPYESDAVFYTEFLIPLIDKCRADIRRGGKVCFNISPKMYRAITKKYKYPACVEQVAMLQQKVRGKDKGDQIYIWQK